MSEDQLDDLMNVASNVVSLGLVGVKDGKFQAGVSTRLIDESIGEVTGRNAARKQLMENKDAARKEEENRQQQFRDEIERRRVNELQASQAAASIRNQGQPVSVIGNSVEQDFLGL